MKTPTKSSLTTKLLPVSEVSLHFGYRDARHFRLAVAPRIGLNVVRVGLRWFSPEEELGRVMLAITDRREVQS